MLVKGGPVVIQDLEKYHLCTQHWMAFDQFDIAILLQCILFAKADTLDYWYLQCHEVWLPLQIFFWYCYIRKPSVNGNKEISQNYVISIQYCVVGCKSTHWGINKMAPHWWQQFEIHFRDWKLLHFNINFTEFCSSGSDWQLLSQHW